MRIIKVNIPKSEIDNDGLEAIKMDRLDNIVLLAGKNGSGKTRILSKISAALNEKPKSSKVSNELLRTEQLKENINSYSNEIVKLNRMLSGATDSSQEDQFRKSLTIYKSGISDFQKELESSLFISSWNLIETNETSDSYSAIHFVPKHLNLSDCNYFNKSQIIGKANAVDQLGVTELPEGTFAKIQVIQNRWFNATHLANSSVSIEEKEIAVTKYEKLNSLIKIFLNTELGRTNDDESTLFGFPLGKSKLSDGQKILLQFCIAIYSQEVALENLILIMDEPENHLHPSVIIETIDRIATCVPNGQIWIATHSIPLLAHYNPSQIWFVENNKISHAGKIPQKVLSSLLGDENEIARLQDFINLPAQFASSQYAFECLFEPKTLQTKPEDPQSVQIRQELQQLSTTGKIRILDFGAGKGRIISNLFDLDAQEQQYVVENLEYIAYDSENKDKEECEKAIKRVYGSCEKKYFNRMDTLFSTYDRESFHVVIMCNVLHEIEPKHWLSLFSTNGTVTKLLANNGVLLLIEDHQIPVGEKAYQNGFLVLDTPQLKDLFKITEKDLDFQFVDARGDGRLKAHRIPKDCLIRIDEVTRIEALKAISITAAEKIKDIRQKDNNYKNGKIHGFWVQQFANAQLNLRELTTDS